MRYVVITPDGDLTHRDRDHDSQILADVGPEGPARVRLDPIYGMAGWVNDVGLRMPETYPRNVVGSCVLAALGAGAQPYAGPVVITGWDPHGEPTEIRDLCLDTVTTVTEVHSLVRAALDDPASVVGATEWGREVRDFATHVREAPTPGITITAL